MAVDHLRNFFSSATGTPSISVMTVIGKGKAKSLIRSIWPVGGTASNAAGNTVWVIDAGKSVYVYQADGTPLGSWAAQGLNQPQDIATDGTDIWIVDDAKDRVFRYAGAAARTFGSQSPSGSFALGAGFSGEHGPDPHNVRLDRPACLLRRVVLPQQVAQPVGRHHPPRLQKKDGE